MFKKTITIDLMRKLASIRGGKCLSQEYIDQKTKLLWECKDGHQWESSSLCVKNCNSWCPYCSGSVSEEKCRFIFEKLTGLKFIKTRKHLYDRLELDGYNDERKFAFEYNGPHHYPEMLQNPFAKSSDMVLERDKRKISLCSKLGIKLIVIPCFINKNDEALLAFIIKKIEKTYNITIQGGIEYDFFDDFNGLPSKLDEIKEISKLHKGKCLAQKYLRDTDKLEFECEKGHRWETRPGVIKKGHWCPSCVKRKKLTIDEMKKMAQENNGNCLSEEYINSHTKLLWICKYGHKWLAKPNTIKNGNWCAACSHIKKLTIEDMQKIAISKEGKCLSKSYNKAHDKLLWECKEGHRWEAKACHVKNSGSWCPICFNSRRGKKLNGTPIS